jgi:opacity protein-like surface antigen
MTGTPSGSASARRRHTTDAESTRDRLAVDAKSHRPHRFVRRTAPAALALALLAATAAPARADITAFLGANMTPDNRRTLGGALGFGFVVVGVEFEYAFTPDDPSATAPSLNTGTGNLLIQTPIAIHGFQPYFTTGGGFYHEVLGAHSDTSFGLNTGGGVKVSLAGPLKLRVDYRVFKLGSGALYSPSHRIYLGLNLGL